jgi:hypothetical protein
MDRESYETEFFDKNEEGPLANSSPKKKKVMYKSLVGNR